MSNSKPATNHNRQESFSNSQFHPDTQHSPELQFSQYIQEGEGDEG